MRAYDNREERLRMDLQGKKRYLIPLGLLLFVLLQSIPWNYLRYAAEVAGRFPEVDRAVVSVEGEAPRTILDPTELAAYKDAIMAAMFRGTKRNIESEADPKNAPAGQKLPPR